MPIITLPDGSHHSFDAPISVLEAAESISSKLARSILAGKVDGKLVDLHFVIAHDAILKLITDCDPDGLEIIRHSTAHLLAHAVKILFPEVQVTIGPVIENGFYYDFAYQRPFVLEDLEVIEKKMAELAKADRPIERKEVMRDEAISYFKSVGERYKAEVIESIPADQVISLYKQGDFVDLCRGPHVPSTGRLTVFKLMKVAGAYWRGNSENEMLQRIYGTAWARKEDLDHYLYQLEEAEKRDHRKLGKQLDLFHMQDEAPGSVFWHPKGWTLFQTLIAYMRKRQDQAGYVEVNTPDIMDRSLWETSGHWSNYRDNMFTTETEDHRIFALKPMNCPGAVSLFAQGIKSYRDLPIKMAEFGKVHRYEPSGALHGLFRLRHFTQDDAHIFCTEEQMTAACLDVITLILDIYRDFGFEDIQIKLSTRPASRIGTDEIWDKLENALSSALDCKEIKYTHMPGEGAFYGPKLEFVLRDAIGREWQCGTLQVDMNLPERFDVDYVAEDNTKKRPVMLHRALFGSLERFMGILVEHYAGAFPFWLAPVQAVVINISEYQLDYAIKVAKELKDLGFRVECDLRNEKITYKIREHSLQRLPYQLIVGDKEKEAGVVSVRSRTGENLGTMTLSALVERFETH